MARVVNGALLLSGVLLIPFASASVLELTGGQSEIEMNGASLSASCITSVPGVRYVTPQTVRVGGSGEVLVVLDNVKPSCASVKTISEPCASARAPSVLDYPALWSCVFTAEGVSLANGVNISGLAADTTNDERDGIVYGVQPWLRCAIPRTALSPLGLSASTPVTMRLTVQYDGVTIGHAGHAGGDVLTFLQADPPSPPGLPPPRSPVTFTTVTFTTCGQTGRDGPTQNMCNSAYASNPLLAGLVNVAPAGIQSWTVPASATYRIVAKGAAGGHRSSGTTAPGRGTIMTGDFTLTQGTTLLILVGQMGSDGSTGGGGGGGTFVVTGTQSNPSPLIIAGGGGGSLDNINMRNGGQLDSGSGAGTDATIAEAGQAAAFHNSGYQAGPGGTSGSGGAKYLGSACSAGAGGGLRTGGANGGNGQGSLGGSSFIAGGGGSAKSTSNFGDGGYGGGSGGNDQCMTASGSGGGYSGGGGAGHDGAGGGGGSYNADASANPKGMEGDNGNDGPGQVTISLA